MEPLLNDAQAATFLQIKRRTLRLWRRTRGLPHFKLTTKVIRYRQRDLEAWLETHRTVVRCVFVSPRLKHTRVPPRGTRSEPAR